MELRHRHLTIIYSGIILAGLFWFFESLLHLWWFNPERGFQLWPPDSNELWMRAFICFSFIAFACLAQYLHLKSLKVEQGKLAVFRATMNTVMDIEGNFLNNLNLYQMELEETHTLSPTSLAELRELIRTTHKRLYSLAAAVSIREEWVAGNIPVIKPNSSDL